MIIKFFRHLFNPFSSRGRSVNFAPRAPKQPVISSDLWNQIMKTVVAVFFLAFLITFVCFSGQSPLRVHIIPGQIFKTRIVAAFPFSYESEIQTRRLRERKSLRIAPVYKLDLERFQNFVKALEAFAQDLRRFAPKWNEASDDISRREKLKALLRSAAARYEIDLKPADVEMILTADEGTRMFLWRESIGLLQSVVEEGIVDSALQTPSGQMSYFMNIDLPTQQQKKSLRTQEDALLHLRIHLSSLDSNRELTNAFFHILRQGIYPNLTYDRERTNEKKMLATHFIKPVMVTVEAGDTILDANAQVTDLHYERLQAYRSNLLRHGTRSFGINQATISSFLIVFSVLLSVAIVAQIFFRNDKTFAIKMTFSSLMLLLNLVCLRIFPCVWEMRFVTNYELLYRALPFLTPIFVGIILVSLLLNRSIGVFYALLLDIFYTMMIGKDLDFFVVLLLAMLLAVYFCQNLLFKSQILRVATLAGACLGVAAFFFTFFDDEPFAIAFSQLFGSTFAGLANGLIAMFLLSPLERLFGLTSNIRLQELSDFNHKLLRQLQVYAPGTYHHSLMVSSIAEQAALDVGANSLLCRVCGLFHDLGKITKPEYFIENQTEHNPHHEKSPRISTLIIKSHVREGVEIGRSARLPRPILDMTQQHHGTTLIQYFYNKALSQRMQPSLPIDDDQHRTIDLGEIDESFYRYDGPKPQTIEAAIIMLSDSIEAASRSLSKITPQSVDSLDRKSVV